MDLKETVKGKVDEIVGKVRNDKDFAAKFKKDPVKAVEGVLGIDLPDEQINGIVTAVKGKLSLDALGGLFGKK